MSVNFDGFVGPSYQLANKYAAVERARNWYFSPNEASEERKSPAQLSCFPGNAAFCPLPVPAPFNRPNRGLLEMRGVAYGVNGNVFFSIDRSGMFSELGTVQNDGAPVSMTANGNGQIFIASGNLGYVYKQGGAFTPTPAGLAGASFATFQDGYVIVVTPNSNQFQISGTDDVPLGDATKWDPANVSVQAGQADKLRALISSREYLRLLGHRRSQIYANVGSNGIGGFPFQSYNETFIETGIAAPFSLADLGDSLVWIGEDARGVRACWRDAAFQPRRISTFAVEQAWQNYASVDDAVAFPFLWMGHLFYQSTFPSASIDPNTGAKTGATWVYDATASELLGRAIWSERNYTDAWGYPRERSEYFHCYAYGLHLVGSSGIDGNPGAIYRYSSAAFSDCGTDYAGAQAQRPIVRDRICPHLWQQNKRIVYNRIEFELQRGVGAASGAGMNPQLMLRWSNDAGNTWTPEQYLSAGAIGQYGIRVYWNRAGYGRDRVFWLRASDPLAWDLVAAELDFIVCSA